MFRKLHPVAGVIAFLTIATFWISTAVSEVSGNLDLIEKVKTTIPWGFILLVPALALTGASGFRLAGPSKAPLILAKKRRMPVIAANGIVVLMPSAFVLAHLARIGDYGTLFYSVQALELAAGATNLALLGLSIRDGLYLKGRISRNR